MNAGYPALVIKKRSAPATWQQRGVVDGPLGSCSCPRGVVAPLRSVDGSGSTGRDTSKDRVGGVSDHPAWTVHRPGAGGLDPLLSGLAVGSDPPTRIGPAGGGHHR